MFLLNNNQSTDMQFKSLDRFLYDINIDLELVKKIHCRIWKKMKSPFIQKQPTRGKRGLKICSKFTGQHACRSVISIKLQSNFIEITFRHGCSPVNLMYIFRTAFPMNTCRWLLLLISLATKWIKFLKSKTQNNKCPFNYPWLY